MKPSVHALCALICLTMPDYAHGADTPVCSLKKIAELETKIDGENLRAKVQINGHDTWMNVATASPVSIISSRLVDELKLPRREVIATILDGSGHRVHEFTVINKLDLAGMSANDTQLFIINAEHSNPSDRLDEEFEGGLGANILAGYDVELDVPHGKMGLFSKDHCKGQVVYWTQDYVTIPFTLDDNFHISFPIKLDGRPLLAMLDTASDRSMVSSQTALREFAFDPAATAMPPDGFDKKGTSDEQPYYLHRFGTLDLGSGVVFHNTEFAVLQDKLKRATIGMQGITRPSVILGLHHLGRLRIYIAYDEKVLYLSAADAN